MQLIRKRSARPLVTMWLTLTCVVSGDLIELTPFSRVLLFLRGVVLFLWLRRVILGRLTLPFSFSILYLGVFPLLLTRKSKLSHLLFKLFLNLDSVLVSRAKRGDV